MFIQLHSIEHVHKDQLRSIQHVCQDQLRSIEHVCKEQLRSIEHVRKEQLRSIEHAREESECHCTPPHPTKPLRAFAENENLRGVQAKMLYVENLMGSHVTPPPEIMV